MENQSTKAENLLEKAEALLEKAEELIEEVIDLEECAKAGKIPPRARSYRFKVNDTLCTWLEPIITGRQVLEQAKLLPPENYNLRLKLAGGKPRKVELDDKINLLEPGVEKFRAIRKGQQEGEFQNRRNAPVSEQDRLFLEGYGLQWETLVDGSPWIIIYNFPLPSGYNHAHVTVAIRLEQGYPLTGLDMMYVFPALIRLDGKPIVQTETLQMIDGRQFQRWSRHRTGDNPWIPGQDSLETHIYLVEEFFQAEFVH